ncbi:transposase [Deinococcus oregonensis]|uniref:Transposase n=1 Tax=Deinococcus oregonensis TaxID=1805970 RepID=A0ABV6B4I3_9DEIO
MFVLGLDEGKSELYARLLQRPESGQAVPLGTVRSVPNTVKGHEQLLAGLMKSGVGGAGTAVVMESTSVDWERVAITLHEAKCHLSVVNAAQIKFFCEKYGKKRKTDKLDADLIARSGAMRHPARSTAPRGRAGRTPGAAACSGEHRGTFDR